MTIANPAACRFAPGSKPMRPYGSLVFADRQGVLVAIWAV